MNDRSRRLVDEFHQKLNKSLDNVFAPGDGYSEEAMIEQVSISVRDIMMDFLHDPGVHVDWVFDVRRSEENKHTLDVLCHAVPKNKFGRMLVDKFYASEAEGGPGLFE